MTTDQWAGACPTCGTVGSDAQALADVRTLDEFDPDWMARGALPRGFCAVRDRCSCDEARAKAAAWVRGLK